VTVSVIIPACDAEATIERALVSLFRQTDGDWEGIIVSDDRRDYSGFLSGKGIGDPRLRFASTGLVRSGCHHARNVGFDLMSGTYVTQLDADDELSSDRFETLRPLAEVYGAAADNLLMLDEETGATIGTIMGEATTLATLNLAAFMKLNAPLVPFIRRDHLLKREPGIEFSEDVVANIQLIDRIGQLPVTASSSYLYRIHGQSMANTSGASKRFERGYSDYIERLETGDGFGLNADNRRIAADGLIAKRELNRAFMEAQMLEPGLGFQEFVKRM
jgi:hypothetical protein